MSLIRVRKSGTDAVAVVQVGGLASWLLDRLRNMRSGVRRCAGKTGPRLALVERINLAPRQTLALVEAEGRRFLIATSAEGASAFYPLQAQSTQTRGARGRVSW